MLIPTTNSNKKIYINNVVFLAVALVVVASSYTVHKVKTTTTVRCSNFKTHAEAQVYFDTHDAKQLDDDRDGIACEQLPFN